MNKPINIQSFVCEIDKCPDIQRLKEENERLSELTCVNCGEKFLSPTGSELYEENVRLKAENHALRQSIKDINIIRLSEKYEQYKQALEKIRNRCLTIMENSINHSNSMIFFAESLQKQIEEVLK